jgi:Helix-turn-helix domain
MDSQDPRQVLARRLRALREERWPGKRIAQHQLARALGGVSVPLISSWESQANPRIPPPQRLEAYAALFATGRSFEGDAARIIDVRDMSDAERQAMSELSRELTQLRKEAMRVGAAAGEPARLALADESLTAGPWRYPNGEDITIVCAQWPRHILMQIPYTDPSDPDYIERLTYADLDALIELHGHMRAANPANQVNLRIPSKLVSDDYTSHLVTLGGIDWNTLTSSAMEKLNLPVRQVADWGVSGGQYFEVSGTETTSRYRPVLKKSGDKMVLDEDVALFARVVNPFNRRRTLTICCGMYGRGTLGAVRALTDPRFRDTNAEYLRARFADSDSYCIVTRVPIQNGTTLTPDWTIDEFKYFEWSGPR